MEGIETKYKEFEKKWNKSWLWHKITFKSYEGKLIQLKNKIKTVLLKLEASSSIEEQQSIVKYYLEKNINLFDDIFKIKD